MHFSFVNKAVLFHVKDLKDQELCEINYKVKPQP